MDAVPPSKGGELNTDLCVAVSFKNERINEKSDTLEHTQKIQATIVLQPFLHFA